MAVPWFIFRNNIITVLRGVTILIVVPKISRHLEVRFC